MLRHFPAIRAFCHRMRSRLCRHAATPYADRYVSYADIRHAIHYLHTLRYIHAAFHKMPALLLRCATSLRVCYAGCLRSRVDYAATLRANIQPCCFTPCCHTLMLIFSPALGHAAASRLICDMTEQRRPEICHAMPLLPLITLTPCYYCFSFTAMLLIIRQLHYFAALPSPLSIAMAIPL